jgi:hypothetical protein
VASFGRPLSINSAAIASRGGISGLQMRSLIGALVNQTTARELRCARKVNTIAASTFGIEGLSRVTEARFASHLNGCRLRVERREGPRNSSYREAAVHVGVAIYVMQQHTANFTGKLARAGAVEESISTISRSARFGGAGLALG